MQDLAGLKDWLGAGAINLFGLPMSGKDTQGEKLAAALGAQLLSAGALVRQTGIGGAEAAAGKLVATDVFQEVILPNLVALAEPGRPLILSSVGRWHGEEEPLLAQLTQSGHELKVVVLLDLPEDEVWRRWQAAQAHGRILEGQNSATLMSESSQNLGAKLTLKEQGLENQQVSGRTPREQSGGQERRADDASPEIFARRLTEFREKTQPVLDFYRERDLLLSVDGTGSREEVFARMVVALVQFGGHKS